MAKHANARACVNRGVGFKSHIVLIPVEPSVTFPASIDIQDNLIVDEGNDLQFAAVALEHPDGSKRLRVRLERLPSSSPSAKPAAKPFDDIPATGQLSITLTDTSISVIQPTVEYVDDDPCE